MSRARSVADLGNQNVLSVSATNGNINVGTGVTLENTGEAQFSGIVTAATVQIGAATTLHSTGLDLGAGNINSHNITSTGNLSVDGNMTVGGLLTYEDVASVDSVGIITAQAGIVIGTGTSISSPASNVLTLGTNNEERLRITSDGNVTISPGTLTVASGKIQSGGDPNDGTAVGAKMLQSGVIQAARASGSGTSAVYMGFTQGTAAATSRINANGSVSFAGGAFAIESDGDISTNVRCHGHIELDSAGTFTSPKIKLFSNTGAANFTGTILNNPADDTYAFQVNAGSTNLGGLYKETSSSRLILGDGSTTKIDLQGAYGNGTFTGQLFVGGSTLLSHPNMDDLQVGNASGNRGLTICSGTTGYGSVCFGDSADGSGDDRYEGFVEYYHNDDSMRLGTAHTEKVHIKSNGDIRMGAPSFGAPLCKLDVVEDATIPYSITTTGSIDFTGLMIRHYEYCQFSVRFTQDLVNTSLLLKFSRSANAPSIGVNYYGSGGYQIDHSVSGNAYISFLSASGGTLYSGTTQQAAYGARSTTWSHTNGTSDVILKISNCAYSTTSIYHFTVNMPRGGINGITVDRTTP